jgi:hypothetical protein
MSCPPGGSPARPKVPVGNVMARAASEGGARPAMANPRRIIRHAGLLALVDAARRPGRLSLRVSPVTTVVVVACDGAASSPPSPLGSDDERNPE